MSFLLLAVLLSLLLSRNFVCACVCSTVLMVTLLLYQRWHALSRQHQHALSTALHLHSTEGKAEPRIAVPWLPPHSHAGALMLITHTLRRTC
jgi:hypothetical protein